MPVPLRTFSVSLLSRAIFVVVGLNVESKRTTCIEHKDTHEVIGRPFIIGGGAGLQGSHLRIENDGYIYSIVGFDIRPLSGARNESDDKPQYDIFNVSRDI
jgi:hypothetical protein